MERQRATKATKAQKAASAKSRNTKMNTSGMKQMLQNVRRPYLRNHPSALSPHAAGGGKSDIAYVADSPMQCSHRTTAGDRYFL